MRETWNIQFILLDEDMEGPGQGLGDFLAKSMLEIFHNAQLEVLLPKNFEIAAQGQKCQNGHLAK